ncbi:RTA1 like protein-domain-containing protein [Paraphoma chrysanthemicola]|uniref:RTA1 like protein-domain-containing protein n=1 Tax=Paraphoma chrysanthemicola TaxID=798071 RepID=A0A8K0R733_9PLEO|nr:RTA1 like protein-domain-containing protein [Paraphoma chrysanthemicola]
MAEEEPKYNYLPSTAAAGIFVALFIVLFVIHLVRLIRTQTWFCIPFLIGALLEALGYVARALGRSNPTSTGLYVMQALLILLGPIFFAASIYMFLGRIMIATNSASYSIIRPTRLTKLFVGGDVLCFLLQAGDALILAGGDDASGANVVKVVILMGLGFQLVIFGFFLVVAGLWHTRLNARKEGESIETFDWRRYMKMLYVVSLIIAFTNLFQVIQEAMGEDGYLLAHEWPIYAFDGAPMVVVLTICSLWLDEKIEFETKYGSSTSLQRDVSDTV